MKITDDYSAKLELWARSGKPVRMPRIANLPHFGHRRFNSYDELNTWKQWLREQLAEKGGAQWWAVRDKFHAGRVPLHSG